MVVNQCMHAKNKSQLPQTNPRDALRYTKMDAQVDRLATDDHRQASI